LLQELSPFTNPKGIDTTSQASGSPFVASSRNYTPNPVKEVVALDCEMVGVGPGGQRSVLARVSIVSITGETVLDCYVKVNETITDFRTHVSGIRSEHLSGEGAFHFGTVRAMVQKILFKKVLVGHAVHNDLEVLNLRHPFWCTRDSATFHLFVKANGQPRRLRELAYTHLGLSIQEDGNGHCSVTDASACIDLYKLYQRNWDHWVQNIVSGSVSVYPPAYRFRH
jgi:RNA exonuclease 4